MWILTKEPDRIRSLMESRGHAMDWPAVTISLGDSALMLILADDTTEEEIRRSAQWWPSWSDIPEEIRAELEVHGKAADIEPIVAAGDTPVRIGDGKQETAAEGIRT